jgi:hypothetical protein
MFDIDKVRGIRENPFFFPTIDGVLKNYKVRSNLIAKLEGNGDVNGHSKILILILQSFCK